MAIMGDGQHHHEGLRGDARGNSRNAALHGDAGRPFRQRRHSHGLPTSTRAIRAPRASRELFCGAVAGDLLYVKASRPFELHVDNSLVVLDGSFLIVDGSGEDPGMRSRSEIVLNQVTAYLTDHLRLVAGVAREGRANKGLTPTYMRSAADCVFASASGKALVHLDGIDAEEQMKRCFLWGESKHNLYANYDQTAGPGAVCGRRYDAAGPLRPGRNGRVHARARLKVRSTAICRHAHA